MAPYTFTVFTPTFNRAHTLDRLYASLARQTDRDFEWVVVDDGSVDGTAAKIEGWIREAPFPIVHERQENRGKHVAHNRGVRLARGELFVAVDSDDELEPEALERFHRHWSALSPEERAGYIGVAAFCRDGATGAVIGRPPSGPIKADALECVFRRQIHHDVAACVRTDLMRAYPFPEPPGSVTYVPESTVWNRMMRGRRFVLTGDILAVKHYGNDGLTLNLTRSFIVHAEARHQYYLGNLNENADVMLRCGKRRYVKDAVQLARTMFHAGRTVRQTWRNLRGALNRAVFVAALPLGWCMHLADRRAVR